LAVAHAVFDELAHQVNLVIGQLRANFFFAFRLRTSVVVVIPAVMVVTVVVFTAAG
jgi:hypothetical protein